MGVTLATLYTGSIYTAQIYLLGNLYQQLAELTLTLTSIHISKIDSDINLYAGVQVLLRYFLSQCILLRVHSIFSVMQNHQKSQTNKNCMYNLLCHSHVYISKT